MRYQLITSIKGSYSITSRRGKIEKLVKLITLEYQTKMIHNDIFLSHKELKDMLA